MVVIVQSQQAESVYLLCYTTKHAACVFEDSGNSGKRKWRFVNEEKLRVRRNRNKHNGPSPKRTSAAARSSTSCSDRREGD